MTSTEAREALTTAIAARTAAVDTAESLTGRRASAAWAVVETLAAAVTFAAREVEMAVRSENEGAAEATIQTLARTA